MRGWPYTRADNGSDPHRDNLTLLKAFAKSNSLKFEVPGPSLTPCGGKFSELFTKFPISRIPMGATELDTKPSCLDTAGASSGTIVSCSLSWNHVHGDHASLRILAFTHVAQNTFSPSTWRCLSGETAVSWIQKAEPPDDHGVDSFVQYALGFMEANRDTRSRAQRRRDAPSLQLRDLYARASRAETSQERAHLLLQASKLRRMRAEGLAQRSFNNNVRHRVGVQKNTQLHNIRGMILSDAVHGPALAGAVSFDRRQWEAEIKHHFEDKWVCDDLDTRRSLMRELCENENVAFKATDVNIVDALDRIRLTNRVDGTGLTTSALYIIGQIAPWFITAAINALISSTTWLQNETIPGTVKGKKAHTVPMSKVRAILPMSSLVQIADAVVAERLNAMIDRMFQPVYGLYEGAVPGSQTLDIAHGVQLMFEKSGDDLGRGAAAESDIRSFYDELALVRLLSWWRDQHAPFELFWPALRLQILPKITLTSGAAAARILPRVCGVQTGTRVANAMGRIPLLSVLRKTIDHLRPLGYPVQDGMLLVATWVDNIITVAKSSNNAVSLQRIVADGLAQSWNLHIKADSKKYCACDPAGTVEALDWERVEVLETLGHFITPSCSLREPWARTKTKLWAAFFKKFKSWRYRKCHPPELLQFFDQHLLPVAAYRFSGWPHQKVVSRQLDQLQARLLTLLMPSTMSSGETPAQFVQRRARTARAYIEPHGKWSSVWAKRVLSWQGHLERKGRPHVWAFELLGVRNAYWLQLQRARFAPTTSTARRPWTALAGRTGTRAGRGSVATRWDEGVQNAYEIQHDERISRRLQDATPKRRKTAVAAEASSFEDFAVVRQVCRKYRACDAYSG